MNIKNIFPLILTCLIFSCNASENSNEQDKLSSAALKNAEKDSVLKDREDSTSNPNVLLNKFESIPDTGFIIMNEYSPDFVYDMKYATDDNFLKKTVYACDQCLLRKEVADAIIKANNSLVNKGFRIKFFDCYRPVDVQKQMWKIYPDARYVANPHTSGSIHNRGGAVDITLVNLEGQELDMGTGFDHFGREAHHAYKNLPDTVLSNRKLLKETLEIYSFQSITSEWWHYSFKSASRYALSNFSVECE